MEANAIAWMSKEDTERFLLELKALTTARLQKEERMLADSAGSAMAALPTQSVRVDFLAAG